VFTQQEAGGLEKAREALRLHREGVPYYEAAKQLGCSIGAYYAARKRALEAMRESLADDADDFRAWETEQGRQSIVRLLADADAAREDGNIAAAVAAEKAAAAIRQRISDMHGASAPAKVGVQVEGPDVLTALGAAVAKAMPRLASVPNGATLGADDGDD
jgi:uncharacterized protein (DUF2461 family)